MSNKAVFDQLSTIVTDNVDWFTVTFADGRTVELYAVDGTVTEYDRPSHGTVDVTIEMSTETFKANEDFPADAGHLFQRQPRRSTYDDAVLTLLDADEDGKPTERTIATIASVERGER